MIHYGKHLILTGNLIIHTKIKTGDIMLKVAHLQKSFNHKVVLEDASFDVQLGQVIHISGENGSGKSTIFKIIAKIIKPDAGQVQMTEDSVIGALIENPGFLEFESGLTNLKFLAQLNKRYDENKVKQLMTDFGLNPNSNRSVAKYSLGMRQKLGIIQAIMEEQNIILLDEPTRGLDQESLAHFVQLVNQLRSDNKLVVIASHDFQAGLKYDFKYRLKDGVLRSED